MYSFGLFCSSKLQKNNQNYTDRNGELSHHRLFSEPTIITTPNRLLHGANANLTVLSPSWNEQWLVYMSSAAHSHVDF